MCRMWSRDWILGFIAASALVTAVDGSIFVAQSAVDLSAGSGASLRAAWTCFGGVGSLGGSAMHLRGGLSGKGKKVKSDEYSDIVAPKKAKSGYLLFADEVRPKVTMENPDKKMTELSAIIGDKWKNLPEADKLKFTQLGEKAKEQFEKDKAEYEAKVPANVRKERDQSVKKKADKKAKKAAKDPNAPKKPLSAFMIYSTKQREQVKAANPDLGFGDLTKKIAAQWSSMTDDQKKVYNEEAAAVKEKYFATVAKYEASRPPAEHAKPSKGKVEKPKKKKSVPS